jgi:lipoprotein-anchoring transpeptidase ErfK/SrfK
MHRILVAALLASALGSPAYGQLLPFFPDSRAQLAPQPQPYYQAQPQYQAQRAQMGGGFIEAIFGGGGYQRPAHAQPQYADPNRYAALDPQLAEARRTEMNPIYQRQVVSYDGNEKAGTIIIDTPRRFLFLVQEDGKAVRYGIGVGRPGFTWAGTKHITRKAEWPDWVPPPEMLRRRPDLPRHMAGGPENPLGARAMYLGDSLYRIHGSNEPWTIGTQVSSGCIRMRNEDVIDLYTRVKVGTKVVVI